MPIARQKLQYPDGRNPPPSKTHWLEGRTPDFRYWTVSDYVAHPDLYGLRCRPRDLPPASQRPHVFRSDPPACPRKRIQTRLRVHRHGLCRISPSLFGKRAMHRMHHQFPTEHWLLPSSEPKPWILGQAIKSILGCTYAGPNLSSTSMRSPIPARPVRNYTPVCLGARRIGYAHV